MKISKNNIALIWSICLLFSLASCANNSQTKTREKVIKKSTGGLSLNKATLEQSNNQGQPLWKIEVKQANYSPDHKKVLIKDIKGNLFQDGKRILQIAAKEGEIYKNGEQIYLKNNIVAVDPRNNITINAQQMRWQPKQDLLTITQRFSVNHLDLQLLADQAQYHSRTQELELTGKILGSSQGPYIKLQTEHLKWLVSQHKIIGDQMLEFIRYQDNSITDQLNTKKMEIDTINKTILSQDTLSFKSINPSIQVSGNNFLWNYRERNLQSQQPVQLYDYKQQVTLTANQSDFDQNKKLAYLKGGVHGLSSRNKSEIYAQQATWDIAAKKVDASGSVIYKQINPEMQLSGDQAVGSLQTNQMVVTSQSGNKVVTQIYPKQKLSNN